MGSYHWATEAPIRTSAIQGRASFLRRGMDAAIAPYVGPTGFQALRELHEPLQKARSDHVLGTDFVVAEQDLPGLAFLRVVADHRNIALSFFHTTCERGDESCAEDGVHATVKFVSQP